MLAAILREIMLQKDYLNGENIESIYFGGGTPSILSDLDLSHIFEQINKYFYVTKNAEITLEANPDDLTNDKLKSFRQHTPINRLSIGIQSFSEKDLRYMNRAHNAEEAKNCVQNAQNQGFEDLTIDLIYGAPTTSHEQWAENLELTFAFGVPHLSCYALTVEPKTALYQQIKNEKTVSPNDENQLHQFQYLVRATQAAGFEQYEISSFTKNKKYARHNTAYWTGHSYLGLGPSAHSFNGASRQWNVAHNLQYIKSLQENKIPFEREFLTVSQRYNEYVMTALRTMWGCELEKIRQKFPKSESHFLMNIKKHIDNKSVVQYENFFFLTEQGKFIADGIASDLFVV